MANIGLAVKAMQDNYTPHKIHVSGLKYNPHTYVIGPSGGIIYRNGQRYVATDSDGQASGNPPEAAIMNTPDCGCCG